MKPRLSSRPRWQVRTPKGDLLVVEYDRIRQRWRVTPGGYEARSLPRALAQATGSPEDAGWIQTAEGLWLGRAPFLDGAIQRDESVRFLDIRRVRVDHDASHGKEVRMPRTLPRPRFRPGDRIRANRSGRAAEVAEVIEARRTTGGRDLYRVRWLEGIETYFVPGSDAEHVEAGSDAGAR